MQEDLMLKINLRKIFDSLKKYPKVSVVLLSLYFLFIILYILVEDYPFLASNFITDFKLCWKLLIIVIISVLLAIVKFKAEDKQWGDERLVQSLMVLIISVVIFVLKPYLRKYHILLPDGWGITELFSFFYIVPLIITWPKFIDALNERLTLELTINLSGIIITIATLLLIIHQIIEESIARNWKIVHTEATRNIGKVKALEYLVGKEQSLERIDLSCETMSRMRRIDYNVHSFTTNTEPHTHCNKLEHKTYLKGLDLSLGDTGNKKANLKGANLKQTNLAEADLTEADLTGADLTGADLTGADLTGADLTDAKFSESVISKVGFTATTLEFVKLSETKFKNSDLSSARIFMANLSGADFTDATVTTENIIYSWVWEDEGGIPQLPVGKPKNQNKPLEPQYLCSSDFRITSDLVKSYISSSVLSGESKAQSELEAVMKKKCKKYK